MLLLGTGLCALSGACARPAPVEEPYTISVPYDLDNLDPASRNRLSDFSLLSNFYEPLVVTDADLSPRAALAARWSNPDALTWLFELRAGVRFHDGGLLAAEDVVWTFERLRRGPALEMSGHVASIASVRARDARTVEVRTTAPVGILLNKLRFVLVVRRGEDFDLLRRQVNGTGPYRLDSWEKGSAMTLRRNEGYWGPRPALGAVRFCLNRSPAVALDDFLAGRSRFVQANAKEAEMRLGREPGVEVRRNNSVSVKFLFFDVARAATPDVPGGRNPFRDGRVRRAVSLAIDREELVRRLSVPAAPASQLVPSFIFGHDPGLPALREDLAGAKRLLAEAGWPHGFEARFPARALFVEAAEIVAGMLARVGVRLRVEALPEPEWFRAMADGRFALTISRFGCPTGDASDLFENALHTSAPERRIGLMNYTGYSSPELDRCVEDAARTLDMSRRQALLHGAMRRAMDDLPFLPLYVDQDLYAFRSGLRWRPRNDNFLIASEIVRGR